MVGYIPISYNNFYPCEIKSKRHEGKAPIFTCENFISLDTETSHNADRTESWVYQWSFSYPIENSNDRYLVYGRKPSELAHALKLIHDMNKLNKNKRMSIFVHNLSYDYEYIKEALEDKFEMKGNLIAINNHNVISYELDGLNFKCSYKLSLKSLDGWCKDLNTKHRKLKGLIDYDIQRFQDTPLTKKDWKYMFYDIVCLDEAIQKQMDKYNDTLISIPLTNTGYVRRETRRKFNEDNYNKNIFKDQALDLDTYTFCKKEFAGGLTHGNRFYADKTVKGTIRHRDFASHYPSQQMCYNAPTSKFSLYYENNGKYDFNINDLWELSKTNCTLTAIQISNLRLRANVTLPYAQVSKFKENQIEKLKLIEDNGRILCMKEGSSLVVINEYDLRWLLKQYKFDYKIIRIYTARKGRFPKYLTDTVMKFFYDKTFYKNECKRLLKEGFSEDSAEYKEMNLNLMIAKGMLNAIYGMSATDPVRTEYYVDEDGEWQHTVIDKEYIEKSLKKYYSKKTSFMNYELGCWTTSLARNELLEFVELIGYDNFIYADTDSIFYISTPEIEEKIEERNAYYRQLDEENGWFIEVNGKKTYFNQFEDENENIIEFRFLHAKCYAYVELLENGKTELHSTIAGVKKFGRGGWTRVKELNDINELTNGKKFTYCGGTTTGYINRKHQVINIDGHMTEVGCAAIIKPREMTLKDSISLTEEDFLVWEVSDIE